MSGHLTKLAIAFAALAFASQAWATTERPTSAEPNTREISKYGCIHFPTGGSWCGDTDYGPMPPQKKK